MSTRVLLIDDQPEVHAVIRSILEQSRLLRANTGFWNDPPVRF